jgi:hypothetical protein
MRICNGEQGALTHALMHKVQFQRVVFLANTVLRGSVHVELPQSEIGACKRCGAIDDDFNRCAQVLKFDLLLLNGNKRLLGCELNGVVYNSCEQDG